MKKEYTKPTAKVMELTYNTIICASPNNLCIRIKDENSPSSTHEQSFRPGSITWNKWNTGE